MVRVPLCYTISDIVTLVLPLFGDLLRYFIPTWRKEAGSKSSPLFVTCRVLGRDRAKSFYQPLLLAMGYVTYPRILLSARVGL